MYLTSPGCLVYRWASLLSFQQVRVEGRDENDILKPIQKKPGVWGPQVPSRVKGQRTCSGAENGFQAFLRMNDCFSWLNFSS